jgi:cell division protein FtsB
LSLGRNIAWLLPFGLLVFAVVALPLRILEEEGLPRYHKLKAELVRAEHENTKLARKLSRLEREIDALRKDPRAVEHIARDELGMVREGEILFQFDP